MYQKDPRDSFVGYGLAMELAKRRETEDEAVRTFRSLLETNPDYLPAYLQLGMLLARRGDSEAARTVYDRGASLAARLGDLHTKEEILAAKDAL